MRIFGLAFLAAITALPPCAAAPTASFFVATNGNDAWSGKLSAPNRARTDGPFSTVRRAQAAVRELKQSQPDRGAPVVVQIRGGDYYLAEPLVFTPEDSGSQGAPVVYEAYRNEKPVLSGGTRLTGWKRDARGWWTLSIPQVQSGEWSFSQMFVNGQRRYRPRLPKEGYYFIEGEVSPSEKTGGKGCDRFRFRQGDAHGDWANLNDVEALCFHIWDMSRFRLASVDEENRVVTFAGQTFTTVWYGNLPAGGRYLLENVREALGQPGEWYLDRKSGLLTYVPRRGEDPTKAVVVAPRLDRLVQLDGDLQKNRWVEHLTFRGLTFSHTNWVTPAEGYSCGQAEVALGGAISAQGARECALENCTINHIGNYAIDLILGCRNNLIENCEITDLGAGGVKIGAQGLVQGESVTSHNVVRNCLIAHGGRMHPAAVGVWIGHSPYNTIEHNDIFDFYYTGISVGWSWGYGQSLAHHNTFAHNHIYQIGQGVLSDMGGIYSLGISPGTVLRNNRIHDVESFGYGGWGIYLDEGSSEIVSEDNLVYHTKSPPFRQHYGKDNVARNNIFALGREAQVGRARAEEHLAYTFEHNIVYWNEGALLGEDWTGNQYRFDYNLYWNPNRKQNIRFSDMTFDQWQKKGQDVHSVIADPLFVNPEKGDFYFRSASPVSKVGFKPFDLDGIGRQPATRKNARVPRAFPGPPPPPPPQPIVEDFELTPVGFKAVGAVTNEENDRATIRVTEETAASGKRSLKFIDIPGQQHEYNPHLFYQPHFGSGEMEGSFDLRVEPGTHMYHEWRDYAIAPFVVGPALWVFEDGTLKANGKELLKIPHGQWIHFDIVCGLGKKAKGSYDLTIRLPGDKDPMVFRDLSCDPSFKSLDWFGFTANANHAGLFYLDNVKLGPSKGKAGHLTP